MKKAFALVLSLCFLFMLLPACAEGALPEIPACSGRLDTRYIATGEEAVAYAKEVWALDYLGTDLTKAEFRVDDWGDNIWHVLAYLDETYLELAFEGDGQVTYINNLDSGWFAVAPALEEADPEDLPPEDSENEEALTKWRKDLDRKMLYPFLETVNPLLYDEYTSLWPVEPGSAGEFLTHFNGAVSDDYYGPVTFELHYSEYYMDEKYRIKIGVQTFPVIRIVYFDVFCDAEEGGNG